MKKGYLFLFLLIFILIGCGGGNEEVEAQEQTSELSPDEEILKKVQDIYQETEFPKSVLHIIEQEFDNLEDEEVKEEVLKVFNDSVLKMLDAEETEEFEHIFQIFYEDDSNEIWYNDFLNEDVKQEVIEKINPVYAFLLKKELNMEVIKEYNEEIRVRAFRPTVVTWLDDNGVSNDFIHDAFSGLLVLKDDNTVIEFKELGVKRIFKVTDAEGNVINPNDPLEELAHEFSMISRQEGSERAKETRKELEESKKIRVGMTKTEVLDRWGEPKDINETITSGTTREQWVYAGSTYLYFEDGILTTIQK